RRMISEFKRGQYKVLCNCEVLTTGFDAPKVTHVVVARPTVSGVLYEQMIGRGLRGPQFGGTKQCVIVNCRDNYGSRRPALGYDAFRRLWGLGQP
ncbi:MAG TPA: helicase-related protein, partial [Blastocatellia bacterium]|nr:helicase-related protein [Blastocatellia bacterium]